MTTNDISKLLNMFYQGETTPEQEQILLHYFESDDVIDELIEEKAIFMTLYRHHQFEIPEHIPDKLNSLIDGLNEKQKTIKPRGTKSKWLAMAGVAASLIFLFTLGYQEAKLGTWMHPKQAKLKDTYTNPKEAHIEAEKALMTLASNFNKGVKKLANVENGITKTQKILNKRLNRK